MKINQPIAIIGMGGIFPDAPNPKKLWENILKRRDSSREVPPDAGPSRLKRRMIRNRGPSTGYTRRADAL